MTRNPPLTADQKKFIKSNGHLSLWEQAKALNIDYWYLARQLKKTSKKDQEMFDLEEFKIKTFGASSTQW